MSAHVLFIKRVGQKDKMRGFAEDIIGFLQQVFNKVNNTGARMQDSIYHMTLKLHFISGFALKRRDFGFRKCDVL